MWEKNSSFWLPRYVKNGRNYFGLFCYVYYFFLGKINGDLKKHSEFLGNTSGKFIFHLISDEFCYWELKNCLKDLCPYNFTPNCLSNFFKEKLYSLRENMEENPFSVGTEKTLFGETKILGSK